MTGFRIGARPRGWHRHLLIYLSMAMLILVSYDIAVHYPFPLRIFTANNLVFEYGLFALVLVCFCFPRAKFDWLSVAAPVTLLLLPLGSFDAFFYFLRRSPRPSDLQNLPLIADFSPLLLCSAGVAVFGCGLLLAGLLVRVARAYPSGTLLPSMLARLLGLAGIITLASSPSTARLRTSLFDYIHWSEELTIRLNGRISSFAFYGDQERLNRDRLRAQVTTVSSPVPSWFSGTPRRTPNIHLIILESFLDPRMVRDVRFDPSPLADELRPYLHSGARFSHVVSPVYGGNSAQAEFELLTGIKALGRVNTIEFNVMRGGRIDGFVSRLKASGYRTVATIASSASYFNAPTAYRSLGFDSPRFLGDSKGGKRPADPVLSDEALFADNLAMLRACSQTEHQTPLLNYVVGFYGHFPYKRNHVKEPDVVTSDPPDGEVNRIANQFYYRTRALGRFLSELQALDPHAIVYITSDHLPPIFDHGIGYDADPYTNSAILLVAGKPIDVSGYQYYEIPWLLWDQLTEVSIPRQPGPDALEKAYYSALAQSLAP